MNPLSVIVRRVIAAALSLLLLGLAHPAGASLAGAQAGHWLGFGRSTSGRTNIVMDLTSLGGYIFRGTISGLPAVQNKLRIEGTTSLDGSIGMVLVDPSSGAHVGVCKGSALTIGNFGLGSGQDDLDSISFDVVGVTGALVSGHMNLLHMFGGLDWQSAGFDWGAVGGFPPDPCDGSFIPGGSDSSDVATLSPTQDTTGAIAGAPNMNSAFFGEMKLSLVPFEMVGTINSKGSMVMMCDGSVRTGGQNTLIGLLFTGGLPAVQRSHQGIVGTYGTGPFGKFLPAVQSNRPGAMSFFWDAAAPTVQGAP